MFLKYRIFLLVIVDILLAVAALYSAFILRFGLHEPCDIFICSSPLVLLFLIVTELFSSYMTESYRFESNVKKRALILNLILGGALSFFILSAFYYISPILMIGRGLLFINVAIFVFYQIVWHFIFFFSHNHPRFNQKVIVVGVGRVAHEIGSVVKKTFAGYSFSGYVQCNNEAIWGKIDPEEILSSSDTLRDAAIQHHADLLIIALTERRGFFPVRDALSCKLNGVELVDAPTFYERVTGSLLLEQITPSWFIYSDGFTRPGIIIFMKRVIDIVLSMIGITLTLPFLPFIIAAIKFDSKGPVLFSQVRVGNREEHFNVLKFRTMRTDAEAASGAVWAVENDPRVTRLGWFMRKTRIDEIPQLINVLKGDMSFVGPRPERPEFVEKLKEKVPYYSRRHFIKPGLTGWAQVRYPYGASVEDALEKLRYDLYYVKNFSPFLDTLIFFETIKVVLFSRGSR